MKKNLSSNSFLILGVALIIIGFLSIIGNVKLFKDVATIVLIIMVVLTIKNLIEFLLKKENNNIKLFTKVISVIISIVMFIFKDYSIAIVPILFSLYILINSMANLFQFVLFKINKLRGGYNYLLLGLFYLTFGFIILFSPLIHLYIVLVILGIYSILLGIGFIFDYFEINHFKKIRIFLPFLVEVLIPISVIQDINKKTNSDNDIYEEINKKDNEKTDLEILIHVTEDGYGKFGHLDICYKNEVISFGNYDPKTSKLNGVFGKGVLFILKNKRKEYIKFCIEDSKKTMFVFGIKLNDAEKENIENNIKKLKEEIIEWNPPYKEALKKDKNVKIEDYMEYSSRIYRALKPKFYKFKNGKYKVFFVLKHNCVTLAHKIIGDLDLLKIYGIVTPGTYYDYLEREYHKKNSIVVSKKIYNKYNIDKIK